MQLDGCRGLCPQTPEVYPLWRYPVDIEKRRHFCRRFPSFYLTACVRSFLSVALFGCNFSIVRNLAIIAFTRFIFRNQYNHTHDADLVIQRPTGSGNHLLLLLKTPAVFTFGEKDVFTEPDSFILFKQGTPQIYRAHGRHFLMIGSISAFQMMKRAF